MTKLPANNLIPTSLAARVLDLACIIQAIPAPTFQEEKRAAFFQERLKAMGLQDVAIDTAGNVLARLPGADPQSHRPLVVSAHMDTVFPINTRLSLQRSPERITGPGIGDNALGLASVIGMVEWIQSRGEPLPGDLWVAMNTGEEGLGDLRGIQAVVDRFGGSPLAYLVVEGMGLGTILNRGLGVERYKISVQTAGGHSWVDYGQPSAIHELARLVTNLTSIDLPRHPCTTMNVGIFQGGTSVNTIASHAWLELDLRSEDSTTLFNLVRQVHQITDRARRGGVSIKIERIGKRQAGQIASNHPLVELAREVLANLGVEARTDIASTDSNQPLSRGYPSICLGITYGNNAHSADEYIQTEPVALGVTQLSMLAARAWDKLA